MNITLKTSGDPDEWNRIVENSPHSTIFHTWKWLKTVEQHTSSKLYPLIAYKKEHPVCAFPIFCQKKGLFKVVFSPPPKAAIPYLGPVFLDLDTLKQSKKESLLVNFQKAFDEYITNELKPHYLTISLPPTMIDTRSFKWSGYQIKPSYNYTIDLRDGDAVIWKNFKKKLRQGINASERKGVLVENGSRDDLEIIYNFLKENYENQHRKITIPSEYLYDIYDLFYPKNMAIFVAKYKGETIGGMVDLSYKSTVYSWIGSTKIKIKGLAANDLIQWRALKWACQNGFDTYEIIGANTPRLSFFKTKYNPELSVYFNATKYSSILIKATELMYINLLKPLEGRLASKRLI